MKKIIILLFIALAFFITATSPIYAGKESSLLPPWFINAIKPLRDSISSLFQRTDSHEARIAELGSKIETLEGKITSLETQIAEMNKTDLTIGTGGVLYYQNNPVGIGTSQPGQIFLNLGSSGYPEGTSLELGTQQQPTQNTENQSQNCTAVYLNGEPLSSGQFIPSDQVTIVCE